MIDPLKLSSLAVAVVATIAVYSKVRSKLVGVVVFVATFVAWTFGAPHIADGLGWLIGFSFG